MEDFSKSEWGGSQTPNTVSVDIVPTKLFGKTRSLAKIMEFTGSGRFLMTSSASGTISMLTANDYDFS